MLASFNQDRAGSASGRAESETRMFTSELLDD